MFFQDPCFIHLFTCTCQTRLLKANYDAFKGLNTGNLGIAGAKGTQSARNDVFSVLTSLNRNFWSSGTDSRGLLQWCIVRKVETGSAMTQPAGSLVL